MQISDNKLVTVEYELYVKTSDNSLELMEATTSENPLVYIHGGGMMMPKFEELMEGRKQGEAFEFSIDCDDAYGQRDEENIVDLPLDVFSPDGKIDTERFFKGAIVPLVDNQGQRINAEIVEIGEQSVSVDLNHPLAGENLYFKGTIAEVRVPSEAELESFNSSCGCHSEGGCESKGCAGCGC